MNAVMCLCISMCIPTATIYYIIPYIIGLFVSTYSTFITMWYNVNTLAILLYSNIIYNQRTYRYTIIPFMYL